MPLLFALLAYSIFGWTYLPGVWPLTTAGALASWRLTTLRSHPWGFILARGSALRHQLSAPVLGHASIVPAVHGQLLVV